MHLVIFVEHKLNHVSLKFTNSPKETAVPIIIIQKEGIIPTNGLPIKDATINANTLPQNPGNMKLSYIYRTCAQM